LIASEKIQHIDMLRMVMLYALRYESHSNNDVSGLVDALRKRGVSDRLRMVCIVISCSEGKINRLQVL
jgi:vacuolar protein sorting-associated protein 45